MEIETINEQESLNTELPTSDSTPVWNKDFLERHGLFGHIYLRTQDKVYYPYWKNQLSRNSYAKLELEKIGQDIEHDNIKVFLLKGYSLMGEIYKDWGERDVSDIDFLISYDQLWRLTDILKMHGYDKKKEAKWLANRYQHIYCKNTGDYNLTIEVNTQLFWSTSLDTENNIIKSHVPGFYQLSRENQLIHLCGFQALQNGYSKLFYLMDVFKYVENHRHEINWPLFWENAKKSKLYKASFFTLFLCQKLGLNIQPILFRAHKEKRISIYFLKRLVHFSYLYSPERYPIHAFLIRFLVKDSFTDNLRYAYAWLRTFKKRHQPTIPLS